VKAGIFSSTCTLKTEDTTPPELEGVTNLAVAQGGTISYKKDVTATDNAGGEVELEVDASDVNLNEIGTYYVTYIAKDGNGNTLEKDVLVDVYDPEEVPDSDISEEEKQARVDTYVEEWLAENITDDMSDLDKLWTMFNYVHETITYTDTSDKSSVAEGAYHAFSTHTGDCYNYFSMMKVLMNGAGFETLDVTRVGGQSQHFWSLVNYEGEWYHIDPICKRSGEEDYYYCFLRTDQEVADFTEEYDNGWEYYTFDHTDLPATPTEPLDITYGRD